MRRELEKMSIEKETKREREPERRKEGQRSLKNRSNWKGGKVKRR